MSDKSETPRYPTIERLADITMTTVGYQKPNLEREAVQCWRELAQARAELAAAQMLNSGHQRLAVAYRERAEKAEAENKALREDAWQPIKTAPTDGSAILVCCGNWITTAHWHRQARAWFNNGPTYEPIPRDELPTHWRHLPQPVGSAAIDAARKKP